MVRYEPPAGVSPAAAAYLVERGLNDKPVAVAIVNMAAKAYLRIGQRADDYVLVPGNTSVPLEAEEELIAKGLSARGASSVRLSDLRTLPRISRQVRGLIESAVEPDLISPHFWCFIPGLTLSMWCFLAALVPEMQILWDSGSSGGIVLPALLSVAFLLSTVRTLPAMIYKIRSLMPGGAPYRMRFLKGDATAPCLLLAATAALAVMGWATSPEFALQFGSFAVVNVLGWMALRSPTAKGRVLLQQLSEFRMFLAAVDSDRLNRSNGLDAASPGAEKYWAWALALNVEHAWGEQFAAAVLNRLGPRSAIESIEGNLPEEGRRAAEILDLRLR
jgi:Predicted membrane protein (DUF2207)